IARTTLTDFTSDELVDRFDHFHGESEVIIPAAGNALVNNDLAGLGDQIDASQRGAERLLGNQVPETIALARSARELGAVAASAFGAGFGGSVWALVPSHASEGFVEAWREGYLHRFSQHVTGAQFFITRAGGPATRLA
ncbi:MAG TPA: hypothetical protein VIP11_23840, partial [Gemmatimonadaceae bacterium]